MIKVILLNTLQKTLLDEAGIPSSEITWDKLRSVLSAEDVWKIKRQTYLALKPAGALSFLGLEGTVEDGEQEPPVDTYEDEKCAIAPLLLTNSVCAVAISPSSLVIWVCSNENTTSDDSGGVRPRIQSMITLCTTLLSVLSFDQMKDTKSVFKQLVLNL